MKKVFLLLFAFSTSIVFSQKKQFQKPNFTTEQKTQLIIKKMSIGLELSDNQITEITPIIKIKVQKMEVLKKEHKAAKNKGIKLSSDEKFALAMNKLDDEAALQKQMKKILNSDQFEIWKKMHRKHKMRKRKMMHRHHKKKQMTKA